MMQYNTLDVKLSKPQLTKIKLGIKNWYSISQFHQMQLVNLKMRLIFHINYYLLTHKFQGFVKRLQMVYRLISNFKKLNCQKRYS